MPGHPERRAAPSAGSTDAQSLFAQQEAAAEAPAEAPERDAADAVAEPAEEPDLEAPLLVADAAADDDEKAVQPALPVDRSLLGLGLYALSGFFLSTMLMLSKKLSALPPLVVKLRGRRLRWCSD